MKKLKYTYQCTTLKPKPNANGSFQRLMVRRNNSKSSLRTGLSHLKEGLFKAYDAECRCNPGEPLQPSFCTDTLHLHSDNPQPPPSAAA